MIKLQFGHLTCLPLDILIHLCSPGQDINYISPMDIIISLYYDPRHVYRAAYTPEAGQLIFLSWT